MAKKDYSPEAIIARAQAQADVRKAEFEEVKKAKDDVATPEPTATPVKAPATPASVLPTPKPVVSQAIQGYKVSRPVAENATPAAPWMARSVSTSGIPLYGTGFKGWMRKLWADISDPQKYFQDQDELTEVEAERIKSAYETNVEAISKAFEEKTKWSKWGEQFFGLTSKEIAAQTAGGLAEAQIAEATDKSVVGTAIARTVNIARDTTQNAIWGGLQILGMDDTVIRKIQATRSGLDAVADKFNKDEESGLYRQLSSYNVLGMYEAGKDMFTVMSAINRGELTWSETGEKIEKYQAGYEMAYSMIWDEYARAEFEKGIAEGKDPETLAYDLGIPGIELAGSIFGSPSTYLGASILKPTNLFSKAGRASADVMTFAGKEVKLFGKTVLLPWKAVARIPTFGELIGAELGMARMVAQSRRFTTSSILPKMEEALKNADKVTGEAQAMKILNEAAKSTANQLDDMRKHKKFWNLASLDNNGKINVTSRDSATFIQGMIVSEGSVDGALQVMRDMVIARSGGDNAAKAIARLMSRPNAATIFSEVGNMTAEVVARLDGKSILGLLKKHTNDPIRVHQELMTNLENVLHNFIPSVEEMADAKRLVNHGGEYSERVAELSQMYDELPKVVKAVNAITQVPDAIAKGTSKAMVYTFMNLVPRSVSRNITGQFLPMASQVGLWNALTNSLTAFVGFSRTKTQDVLLAGQELIMKRLKYIPAEATFGIGDKLPMPKKGVFGIGFLPVMQRTEQITANRIILEVASDEILKGLPAVVNDLPEWNAVVNALPKEQQPLLFSAYRRAYGDFDEAIDIFRKWVGEGSIEAWRVTEPSEAMRRQLSSLGLMDSFYDVQMNARNSDDFKAFVDDAIKTYEKTITDEAVKLPWVLDALPEKLSAFGMDLSEHASESQAQVVRGLIQSWQMTLDQLDNTRGAFLQAARKKATALAAQTGDVTLSNQIEELASQMSSIGSVTTKNHDEINWLREAVVAGIDSVNPNMVQADFVKFFKNPVKIGNKELFNMSKIYPHADLSKMNARQFKKLAWTALFETIATKYRDVNTGIFESSIGKMEEVAKLLGSSMEEVVGSGKNNVFKGLFELRHTSMQIEEAYSWQRFFRQLPFDEDKGSLLKDVVGKFESVFPEWKGGQNHIVNAVNQGLTKKIPYEEITLKQALAAIGKNLIPPPNNQLPSEAEALYRGMANFTEDIKGWSDTVLNDWGKTVKSLTVNVEDKLKSLNKALNPRINKLRMEAGITASSTRNFVLHDYNKTYLDHALTYLLGNSLHYWTTRTNAKVLETVLDQPRYANMYMKYKQYNAKRNSDMPDWYKQNIQINSLMGIDLKNPYFVNLEASINPVYNITGTDFNDPRKRVDWVTRAIDDMGKQGVSFSPLVSWALAMALYDQGEEDAGQRWAGRLVPFSPIVKSLSAKMGNAVEIDPFVRFLDGGVDPYERNRVAAQLAMMVRNGEITSQQMIEISRNKEGEWWDLAVKRSADARFVSDASSFFLGAGFRPRTKEDMVIEKFWNDYSKLIASRDAMTPDQYRQAWDNLREHPEYGMFADALLLSRKSGDDMDTAYTYNVFGRIPPGQLNDAAESVGINPELLNLFYEKKGDINAMGLSEAERKRFMGDVADLGAWLQIPDNATRREWNNAKSQYKNMEASMVTRFGEDVMDKLNDFYESPDKATYIEEHPDIQQILDFRSSMMVGNQLLLKYYGGIEELERYHTNNMYQALEKKFGKDIRKVEQEYFDIYNVEKIQFLQEHPELEDFWDRKDELNAQNESALQQEFGNEIFVIADEYGDIFDKAEKKKFLREHPELRDYWDMRDDLKKENNAVLLDEFGADIRRLETQYFDPALDQRGVFLEAHPELRPYWEAKAEMRGDVQRSVVEFGKNLPEPVYSTTEDRLVTPQQLQDMTAPTPQISFAEWQGVIGQPMSELIQSYWYDDQELPREVTSSLDYMAEEYGYNSGDDMLQAILMSMP